MDQELTGIKPITEYDARQTDFFTPTLPRGGGARQDQPANQTMKAQFRPGSSEKPRPITVEQPPYDEHAPGTGYILKSGSLTCQNKYGEFIPNIIN